MAIGSLSAAARVFSSLANTIQPLDAIDPLAAVDPLAAAVDPLIVAVLLARPILAVIYAITIAVSVWLFHDARRRGRSVVVAVGWAVGGLLLPTIVHFLYLYGRLKTEGSVTGPPLDREE